MDPEDPADEPLVPDELLIDVVHYACREAEVGNFAVLSEWTSFRDGPPPGFTNCWDRKCATVLATVARHPSHHMAVILPPLEIPLPPSHAQPPVLAASVSLPALSTLDTLEQEQIQW